MMVESALARSLAGPASAGIIGTIASFHWRFNVKK
jgi:hypothetical protein